MLHDMNLFITYKKLQFNIKSIINSNVFNIFHVQETQ